MHENVLKLMASTKPHPENSSRRTSSRTNAKKTAKSKIPMHNKFNLQKNQRQKILKKGRGKKNLTYRRISI